MSDVTPIMSVEGATQAIASFEGNAEDFELPISVELLDPVGMNMAIITDAILAKGWMPNGFEDKGDRRIYKYIKAE